MDIPFAETSPVWVKFGKIRNIVFVGRETICVADGCHLVFYNLNTKTEVIYTAGSDAVGMGVACIAGHRTYSVFAFAEKSSAAAIFICTCPEFNRIIKLPGGTNDGYISLIFSEAEYLISLSGIPSFEITVWNWRNGDKINSKATTVDTPNQLLKCNYGTPVLLAQMGINTKQIYIWEILQCGKRCILEPHTVTTTVLKQVYMAMQWTSEGGLFLLDQWGDIYTVNTEYRTELVIKCEVTGDKPVYFSWFKAGLAVACPNGTMMHFKKSGNWSCDWKVTPEYTIVRLLNSPRDFLVAVSERGDVLLFNTQINEFSFVKQYETLFQGLCLIYPIGDIIVTMAWRSTVTAWEVATGFPIDSVDFESDTLAIVSNPEYPYFVVGFAGGKIELFSLYSGKKIELLTSFLLTKNDITHVSFAESGKLLIAANMEIGEFFIIEGVPGTKMRVVATCCAHRQIADYILVGSKTCLRLFALNVTSDTYVVGNVITRFCIVKDKECPDVKDYIVENENALYSRLYATAKPNRDRIFYAMPVKAKCLHELEVKRGDNYARLVGKTTTKHQMRKILFRFDLYHVISFGYDGLIIIRDWNWQETHIIMPHHRFDGGVQEAYVHPNGKYVISMGRNNLITCTCITEKEIDQEQMNQLRSTLETPRLMVMFKHPTTGFLPKGEFEGTTWLEMEQMKKKEQEYLKCELQRKSILKKFKQIKKLVSHLLTKNLEGPENEYLDIQDFNLDSELKEQSWLENNEKCKETKKYLEKLIVAQDNVSQWIKEYCWNTMAEQGKSMYGIFSDLEVENYVLLPDDVPQMEIVNYIEEHRAIEEMMANTEIFEPWVPRTPSQMKAFMDIKPSFVQVGKTKSLYLEEDGSQDGSIMSTTQRQGMDEETMTAFAGSITHTFIELNKGHYTQHQIQTFLQTEYQSILSKVENIKLRRYFNKEFEGLMSLKVRQINELVEKNNRLRHIISELNYFSKPEDRMDIAVSDPEWRQEEFPEQILQVKDSEVTITPYISPAEQAILDAEAAERERIRLLLLADDFKERALIAMMNGVLEVRWEDELRKDVPPPKCMAEKEPEEYNEEDLRAIRDFEEKVKFLGSERLRYKRMLVAEYGNLGNTVRESLKKFNNRIEDLLLMKIKVDSAIGQENLKISRLRLRNFRRIEMHKAERDLQIDITANEKQIEKLTKLITSLYDDSNECRAVLEALQGKEKTIEKTFRRDIQDVSPTAQEIGQRLYRRRPKTNVRSITSVSMLVELGKCVVTKEKSVILNQDALDFLKALDHIDLYVGIPNAVDEHLYATICKHRRIKIESEIKIKAAQMEMTECDNNIAYLHKVLTHNKEFAHKLNADLAQIRLDKIKEAQDIELQLVLKQGFVEMPMSGEIVDFENAVMLSRKDTEDINHIILAAGNRKLKAMRDTMNFRRGILAMEWLHKKMKMQIADLEDHLNDIRAIKVTKEIQTFMKSKARGESPDKGLTFEQEVDLVRQSYQRLIDQKKNDCYVLQVNIDSVKEGNNSLDKAIINLNVDVCEFRLNVDGNIIRREKQLIDARMHTLINRSKLVKQIQENHNQILMLQTELELLRLKTYPTLKYKICE